MGLQLGGVFDLNQDWKPPHDEHRVGRNCDLRTLGRTAAQLRKIWDVWVKLGGTIHDETDTNEPHYHLRF